MEKKLITEIIDEELEQYFQENGSSPEEVMSQDNVLVRKSLKELDRFLDTMAAVDPSKVSESHYNELSNYLEKYVLPLINDFKQKWSGAHQGAA